MMLYGVPGNQGNSELISQLGQDEQHEDTVIHKSYQCSGGLREYLSIKSFNVRED
jgi:hypothetical protein